MSKILTGKEALAALAEGKSLENWNGSIWWDVEGTWQLDVFLKTDRKFRLKPRTITINGIEVPAPFEPKEGERFHYLSDDSIDGYHTGTFSTDLHSGLVCGAYQTTEEIKQVVAALRKVFGGTA